MDDTIQRRVFVTAIERVAYHAALKGILDRVNDLVTAVQHASAMQQRAGIADDAPLSDEERAVFAASQRMVAQAAQRDPGILMLFPSPQPTVTASEGA